MNGEEIRHHALQIAAMRRSNRSLGQRRRIDRGYDTAQDFHQGNRTLPVSRNNTESGVGAVDDVFRAREAAGYFPRERWS